MIRITKAERDHLQRRFPGLEVVRTVNGLGLLWTMRNVVRSAATRLYSHLYQCSSRGDLLLEMQNPFRKHSYRRSTLLRSRRCTRHCQILRIFSNLEHVTQNINRIVHDLNSGVKWNREMHEEVVNCLNELQRMKDELTELKVDYLADWDKIFAQADDLISRSSCEPLAGDEL